MVNSFLAVEKNSPMYARESFSITNATIGAIDEPHLRSSNPNLNTPSRIHLIARSVQDLHASDTYQRHTFRSRNSPSPQRSAGRSYKGHFLSNRDAHMSL